MCGTAMGWKGPKGEGGMLGGWERGRGDIMYGWRAQVPGKSPSFVVANGTGEEAR